MFLPENVELNEREEKERKEALERIEAWSMELIPEGIREDAFVAIREMACGDPNCSPVDTAVTIMFENGVDGMFGVPKMAKEITKEELESHFPTEEVLLKWSRGVEADWPPLPELRFNVGTRVLCRTGPDMEKDWSPGTITLQWYQDPRWPDGTYVPYQIRLDDDRLIFAPADVDQVIKRELPEELDESAAANEELTKGELPEELDASVANE